jgi:hypothetical protein
MKQNEAEKAESLRQQWTGRMTEPEVEFIRDVQGFLDFAIRNGLSFAVALAAVVQDVNEIARDGFEFDKTRSRGFRPKVSGYSKISDDDFGEGEIS